MLEMREDEGGPGDVSDSAGAGGDVLRQPPPLGGHREPALARTAHTSLELVEGAVVPSQRRPLPRLLEGGDDISDCGTYRHEKILIRWPQVRILPGAPRNPISGGM